jgi:hypothetical protein
MAHGEHLFVSQASDGSIVVTLYGTLFYCDPLLGRFIGQPTFSVVAPNVNVVSTISMGECPAPPPGFVPPPPSPYAISVNLGVLPDGVYSTTWSFVGGIPQSFHTTFQIQAGLLPVPMPVPALSRPAVLSLMVLLYLSYRLLSRQIQP